MFNNLNGCMIRCRKKKKNFEKISTPLNIDKKNIIFGKITISLRYLKLNSDGSINENKSKTINIRNSLESIEFDSLFEAVDSLNKHIDNYKINYIPYIEIIFGHGTTWIMPENSRDLTGIGNAYSSETLLLNIGRKETFIGRIGFYGVGQGTSTIRGSCTCNIYNLGALPIINSLSLLQSEDSLQFDNRLILNNIFWIGKLAINIFYPTDSNDPVIAPDYEVAEDIFDMSKNSYTVKTNTTYDDIMDWTLTRRPEVEIINVWIELEDPPVKTDEPDKGTSLISPEPTLETPLFFINTPAMSRFFMVQSNIMTYIMPFSVDIPVSSFSTQFLMKGVNDTFIQDCSFSTRAFGQTTPDYTCCRFYNNGKVSILNSQFNGALICQSDKLALFGCYLLGVGVYSDESTSNEISTTPGLIFIPPSGDAPKLANYPQNDARFIQSSCEWVSYIHNWTVNDKNDVSGTISTNSIDSITNKFNFQQKILPWRLYDAQNSWDGTTNKLAIFFNSASFYMVDPSVKGDFTKGFTFDCITLTNTDSCKLSFDQSASLTGRISIFPPNSP